MLPPPPGGRELDEVPDGKPPVHGTVEPREARPPTWGALRAHTRNLPHASTVHTHHLLYTQAYLGTHLTPTFTYVYTHV